MRHSIVVLALIVGSCLAGFIIEESREKKSVYLVEAVAKFLKTCYGKRVNAVSFAGNTDVIPVNILFDQSIPVILINNTKRTSSDVRRNFVHRLQVSVVAASGPTELTEILNQFKDSIWWNHLASFIILTWPSESKNECSNAYEMLWAAWEANLLNAKLMCLHSEKEPLIYGYNPFTEKAPHPWEMKKTYRGPNDHPWTIFARRFQEDEGICEELDFEKTNDLGGYEIRSGALLAPGYWLIDVNKTSNDGFGGAFGNLAKILCRTLNATCTLQVLDFTQYGDPQIFNRISDIFLFPRLQMSSINFTMIYPHWQSGMVILTLYSGEVSQLAKLISVIDRTSRYGVGLVLFITLLFFKYCVRLGLMPSMLNNIRLICNGSIENVPQKESLRIYLAGLFIFVVTIQAIYQGKLASLLTTPVSLPNVNTLEDLANSHLTIYLHKSYTYLVKDSIFKDRYIELAIGADIFDKKLYNSSVCSIVDKYYAIDGVVKQKLHVSRGTISENYWAYQIRQNWPIEQRVNIIIQRLVEANLITYWHMEHHLTKIDRTKYNEKLKDDQQFKNITLDDLTFAFAILGIGLAIASAVFVIEIGVNRIRLRTAVPWLRQVQNRLGRKNK